MIPSGNQLLWFVLTKPQAAVIDNKKLRFLVNLACACSTDRIDADTCVDRLVRQAVAYGADVLPPIRPGGKPRRKWHGKRGSSGDDLIMAFQLCLAANRLFFSQPQKYPSTRHIV